MDNLVSILIPVYNAEAWLADTLESALSQTWPDKEIILVDDGSRDRSLEIASRFQARGVKVISQTNRGAAAARNRALCEAQGDFIQYLDADDLLAANKIERQVQAAKATGSDGVISGEWARFYTTPQEANFDWQPFRTDMEPVAWLVHVWSHHLMMHPSAWLVPRGVADRAGLWNEALSLNDDGEYFCRIVLASRQVQFCDGAKSYYRSGLPASLSGVRSAKAWESALLALELNCQNLLAKENSPRTRAACAATFQRFVYETYPDVPVLRQRAESKAEELGGGDVRPSGGPFFRLTASAVGWKAARRLQRFLYRHGYTQLRTVGGRSE